MKPIAKRLLQLVNMVSATSNPGFHFFLFILSLATLLILTSSRDYHQPKFSLPLDELHTALFVFGDSVYDPRNNNNLNVSIGFKANYPPYGETFFKNPTGRFCDGRIVPDFIAMDAKLPLWKPYLVPNGSHFLYTNGTNFAASGAGVLDETNPGSINLRMQLSFFKNVSNSLKQLLGSEQAKKLLRRAVYLSSIGGNDYASFMGSYPNASTSEQQQYVKIVIGNLTNVNKQIYDLGGRKFAFQNVGPMGCLPFEKQIYNLSGSDCIEELLQLPKLHNNALVNATKELESQLPGFKYSIFDFYASLIDIMKDPQKYGFKVADAACCGTGSLDAESCGRGTYQLCCNPNDYVFFDGAHTTEAVNVKLAKLFWSGGLNFTSPYNVKQLYELQPSMELLSEDI